MPCPITDLHFLNLPSELRNQVYTYIFPPNTRFFTTQRMSDPTHETGSNYIKNNAPRRHPVVVDDVEIKYLLGILGTCKTIRREATSILNHNLKGTFIIMTAFEFRRVPSVILEMIDTVVRGRAITSSTKYRYVLRFPNLKTVKIGTFVDSKQNVLSHSMNLHPISGNKAYKVLVAEYFNTTMPRSTRTIGHQLAYPTPFQITFDHTPMRWKLLSGKCPATILVHIYVVDATAKGGADPHEGLLVNFDYNHGRVDSIEEKRFARLLNEDLPNPSHRSWSSVKSWVMTEPEEKSSI